MKGLDIVVYYGDIEDHQGAAKAAAKLQKDVERLEAKINHERFFFIVFIIALFDSVAFYFYKTWAAPVCLVAMEFAGLFVLARHLGISEIISLTFEVIKSWGHRDADPAG